MQVIERLRRETFRAGGLAPRLIKPLVFALKVAAQNARHTSFDAVGFRDRFVTTLPVARIPAPQAAPDAGDGTKDGTRKPPRSEREMEGEDLAGND